MRYPEVPEPNTVIEVSAQDDSFNLVDMYFVDKTLTQLVDKGLVYGYLIRSDYSRLDSDFGTPLKVNLATNEWQYVESPATSVLGDSLVEPLLAEMDRNRHALEVAIGYSPVRVSIAGHPGIGYAHRTAEDRDGLVERILAAGFRQQVSE